MSSGDTWKYVESGEGYSIKLSTLIEISMQTDRQADKQTHIIVVRHIELWITIKETVTLTKYIMVTIISKANLSAQ